MTGGTAVILGRTGSNFGAGMTGGMAFVLDVDGSFERHANPESIVWQRLGSTYWEGVLKALVEEHARSEEHTSELQSLMRISYAVFCLKKKKINSNINITTTQNNT